MGTLDERTAAVEQRLAAVEARLWHLEAWAGGTTRRSSPERPSRPDQATAAGTAGGVGATGPDFAAEAVAVPAPADRGRWQEWTPSRVLAFAGGAVLLLGVGFLLRYAAAQGWLNPAVRVVLALVGSAATATWGLRLERADATRTVGQICTATGLTGAYVAIVAAAAGYELVPGLLGLVGAITVAAGAALYGIWARSQAIAALGIGGALVSPVIVDAVNGPLTLVLLLVASAAAVAVAIRMQWPLITVLAFLLVMPQAAFANDASMVAALTLIALAGTLFLAAAIVHGAGATQVERGVGAILAGVDVAAVTLIGPLLWIGVPGVPAEFEGWWAAGVALVVLTVGLGTAARPTRSRASVVAAVAGLTAADLSATVLLNGHVVTGFLVAAVVAAATLIRLPRLADTARALLLSQLAIAAAWLLTVDLPDAPRGSTEALLLVAALAAAGVAAALLAYPAGARIAVWPGAVLLGLGAVRLLAIEAPPSALLTGTEDLGGALMICAVLVVAACVLGHFVTPRFGQAAVVAVNYALSLAAVAMDPDGTGRVALTALWATSGAIALAVGRRLERADVRRAGGALLIAAVTKAALVDTTTLTGTNRAAALLLCGAVLIATAVAEARAAGATRRVPAARDGAVR